MKYSRSLEAPNFSMQTEAPTTRLAPLVILGILSVIVVVYAQTQNTIGKTTQALESPPQWSQCMTSLVNDFANIDPLVIRTKPAGKGITLWLMDEHDNVKKMDLLEDMADDIRDSLWKLTKRATTKHKVFSQDGKQVLLYGSDAVSVDPSSCSITDVYIAKQDGSIHPQISIAAEAASGSSQCIQCGQTITNQLSSTKRTETFYFNPGKKNLKTLVIDTCSPMTKIDTTLKLVGPNGNQIAYHDDTCPGATPNRQEEMIFRDITSSSSPVKLDTVYSVIVGGYGSSVGQFSLRMKCQEAVPSPKCQAGWPVETRGDVDSPGWTMVSPDNSFACYGRVTEWKYQAKRSIPFRAIVWRPEQGTKFKIVGINNIPAGVTGAPVTYTVPLDERIEVQPGDVIGWSFGNPCLEFNAGGSKSVRWVGGNLHAGLKKGQTRNINHGVEKRQYSIAATVW